MRTNLHARLTVIFCLSALTLDATSVTFTDYHVVFTENSAIGVPSVAIDDVGDLAGTEFFRSEPNIGSNDQGFVLPAGSTSLQTLTYPGATYTEVLGINSAGEVAGFAFFGSGNTAVFTGFTEIDGHYSPVAGVAADTMLSAINNRGDVTGTLGSSPEPGTGFAIINGLVESFVVSGASSSTHPTGINDAGQIVGYTVPGQNPGFLRNPDGTITLLPTFANTPQSVPQAINDAGLIVGNYGVPNQDTSAGFLEAGSTSFSFMAPGAIATYLTGINNHNQIVGIALDSSGGSSVFTVDANVTLTPEPSSLVLVGATLAAFPYLRQRVRKRSTIRDTAG